MCILRLLPQDCRVTGEVRYQDQDLLQLPDAELSKIRWEKLAVVFQGAMNSLSPVHRISTQFEDIYREHRPGTSREEIKEKSLGLFRKMSLDERSYRAYPHELSGGMMQRVNIALSLLLDPDILILDEATTALDVITEQQIMEEILAIEEERSLLRLTITHDVSVVAKSCKEVIVMYAGRILEIGPVDQVFKMPQHPYTKGLLASRPRFEKRGELLQGIPGNIPDLREEGTPCCFAPRCPYAEEPCFREQPIIRGEGEHYYACHFPPEQR